MDFTNSEPEHKHVLLAMVLVLDIRSSKDALRVGDVKEYVRWCLCIVKPTQAIC